MNDKEKEIFPTEKLREIARNVSDDLFKSIEIHTKDLPDTDDLQMLQASLTMMVLTHLTATTLQIVPEEHFADTIKKFVDGVIVMYALIRKINKTS